MTTISICHTTTYSYRSPANLGPHRLLLRPRESRNLRIKSHEIECTPEARVTWANDVFGNAVATAVFSEATEKLAIESKVELSLDEDPWPVYEIAGSASEYPFLLTEDEVSDLGALRLQSYLDVDGNLRDWTQGFVAGSRTDTLSLLKDLCAGVASQISYETREEENTQTPLQTLALARGSCRDLAALFVDAVRSLGFGARIVSGYLYDEEGNASGFSGNGSTHAWAETYVPGAGWITFDPTNRSVGGHNLVPVAVARHIRQTAPIAGSFVGEKENFDRMDVSVVIVPG